MTRKPMMLPMLNLIKEADFELGRVAETQIRVIESDDKRMYLMRNSIPVPPDWHVHLAEGCH